MHKDNKKSLLVQGVFLIEKKHDFFPNQK